MGIDRVALLHETVSPTAPAHADVYVACLGDYAPAASAAAERVRSATALRVLQHAGSGGLRSQLAEADKSGARWALIVGEAEVAENCVSLKWLREERPQARLAIAAAVEAMADG